VHALLHWQVAAPKFCALYIPLLCFALLSLVPKSDAQTNICGIKNKVIFPGEQINFVVYYNLSAVWVAAGSASFSTRLAQLDGTPVFHLKGVGKTYKSYDWIYKVDDMYESFVDTAILLPLKFQRKVREQKHTKTEYVRFVPTKQKAFSNNKTFTVPLCVQDVLSAIYLARNIDYSAFKVGDKIPYDMFIDEEIHPLYIKYLGKTTITTRFGIFKVIKLRPLLVAGTIFKGGENMDIYVTDDANRVPVRINSPILVGSIKVDMISYSGLRYPLTSLIKKK
jgi:hypothetical protein